MELSKKQIDITKGVAILFMLLLHLFCTKQYQGLFEPLIMIGEVPLIYYFALFGDCCVAIYCFCSGYGLLIGYKNNKKTYFRKNLIRILKLYVNYWIITLIFVIGIGFIMGQSDIYPGNIKTLILSLTAINPAYNGAWWFITIYIVLVLISPIINEIVMKYNYKIVIGLSFIFYIFAYIQRIKVVMVFENQILQWFITQLALLGTSQLPFIIGSIFAYYKIYSILYSFFEKIKLKNIVCILLIGSLIVVHSFIETLFIAVFTGIAFILLFNMIDKPKWLDNILIYISKHSTNMWLIHMFFYMIFFKEIIFAPKYPIFIFGWLIIICLISSHIINLVYHPLINLINQKLYKPTTTYN